MLKYLLTLIRFFVGGLFIFSGLIKVNDPVGTAIKMEEYFDVFAADIAGFFSAFKLFSLEIAVILVVAEVVLGVMLLVGARLRFTVYALGAMVLFFTFLTFYSAYFNKVTDCGCFGDAIKLTPWQSFYKDIVLLVLIGVLFIYRHQLPKNSPTWALWTTRISTLLSVIIAITAINTLPFIDFRAYKEGVNIPEAMLPSAPLQYAYIMEKDGERYTFEQYPDDESYTFVEMLLTNEEALPKIADFAVWNPEGDYTAEILSGKQAILIITDIEKMDRKMLNEIQELFLKAEQAGIQPAVLAANSAEKIELFLQSQNWDFTYYQGDATVLKTIIRSNPGLLLLNEGTVLKKYHYRTLPSWADLLEAFTR